MRTRTIAQLCLVVSACGSSGGRQSVSPSTLDESWDSANRPSLIGAHALRYEELTAPSALRGAVPEKPWRDSYWPYHRKNIAYRYMTNSDFGSFAEQVADANAALGSQTLSPAEKYDALSGDGGFSLTRESWGLHDYYRGKYGDDLGKWSWMGICAGWAPASIAEPAPTQHVLAVNQSGREVLFFAGDVRALLSKAYDVNRTTDGYRMVGSRCNDPEYVLPRDALGRSLDGRLSATLESFVILSDHGRSTGALEVARDALSPEPYWLVAPEPLAKMSGVTRFWRYARRTDVVRDLAANTRGAHAVSPEPLDVELYKSCRDVNPAVLHFAMVQNLSDAASPKRSFVVELSRDVEIWNHPAWGYTAKLGKPRALASDPLDRRVFRAAGTTQLVDVEAKLLYVSGAAPQQSYPTDDGTALDWDDYDLRPWTYPSLDLAYTLELDASGLVVGGEWNEATNTRLALPDFFWRTYGKVTDELKDGGPSPLKYSVLEKLAACSRQAPTLAVPASSGSGTSYLAVRCPI